MEFSFSLVLAHTGKAELSIHAKIVKSYLTCHIKVKIFVKGLSM
jgi:hypothetical protein